MFSQRDSPARTPFVPLGHLGHRARGTQTVDATGTSGATAESIAERHTFSSDCTALNDFGASAVSGTSGTQSNSDFTSGFCTGPFDTRRY
ncbi:hypothetical protein [Streptomyces guryensis]|uniref:Uncharacterized protein n=1 Tax=Streptomyces guryensis TaxID=2886947 RepID=A0A9Q3Z916_9ACTN|nr:hypothetical protein [Streptomyces guryensis]MCD9879836.1 hypothetical protein [Streptomyces guryensis]